jgi:hypothetical protein
LEAVGVEAVAGDGGQDVDVVDDGGDEGAAASDSELLPPVPEAAVHGGEPARARVCSSVARAAAAGSGGKAQLEGRFLGGRPPYGYRLVDAGPHPNPAKAADGKRLHALAPDPNTADVVARIFAEYLSGAGAEGDCGDAHP